MYNNCVPCRCHKMIALIKKIFECELNKVWEEKWEEEWNKHTPPTPTAGIMKGIQAQLYGTRNQNRTIELNEIIPFTTIINNTSDITLNNGEFTLPKTGEYLVDWTIVGGVGISDGYNAFAVNINGMSKAQSSSRTQNATFEGASWISAEAGDILTLKNIAQRIALSSVFDPERAAAINMQASITITYLD